MPRPSLKKERREQIFIAFETCVARFGIEGATLERIAEEAGLARALIRHNVGNKEDLVNGLVERFLARSKASSAAMLASLPESGQLTTLVEWLFDPTYSDPQLVLISEALIAASADDHILAKKMRKWTTDFVTSIETVILKDYPNANNEQVIAVAAGITGIYFTVESMSPLGGIKGLAESSKDAVKILINSLEA